MKKSILVCLLALVMVLAMTGCACEHVWQDANCVNPKTCSECGETEGAPLGHTWKAATCTEAKTCETCGAVEGEAKGHTWVEATCTEAKTCSECKLTEGEALGHVWQDATTEAPKTCATCAATEGERIITDERFTTASAAPVLGTWRIQETMTGADLGLADSELTVPCTTTYVFGPAGDAKIQMMPDDPAAFMTMMEDAMVKSLYAEFAQQGLNESQSDAAMLATYGLDVKGYAASLMASISVEDLFAVYGLEGVYYVQDGKIYLGMDWDSAMEPEVFVVDGDKLLLGEGEEQESLTRVVEE